MSVITAIDDLVATLKTFEYRDSPLRVTPRLEDVSPPCVWVALEHIDRIVLDGSAVELQFAIFLVSNGIDEYRAIQDLEGLLEPVLEVVEPTGPITVVAVNAPNNQQGLAALRIPTTIPTSL